MGFGCLGARSKKGGFCLCKIFAKACDLGLCMDDSVSGCFTLGESCDYSFCYFVCYQPAVFIVSLCERVFPIVLFITVFVLCHGTKKMLIVISGFACIYKCIFLIIIFNLLFAERKK